MMGYYYFFFVSFSDYPLEKAAIALTLLNPIDMARVFILLKLDISALMGYTGAVFNQFFGTLHGMTISFLAMLIWILINFVFIYRIARKKDF